MTTSSIARRAAGGLCASVLALATLAGCERRPTEVPTPSPGTPPATTPTPPTTGDTTSTTPSASAASQ